MSTLRPHHAAALFAAGIACLCLICAFGCGGGGNTYSPVTGSARTNIPAPSFSIAVSPPSKTVIQSATATYIVAITAINGFGGSVTLSVSGLPAGAAGSFGSSSIIPTAAGVSTTLSITTSATGDTITPTGSSTISVTGSSAGESHVAFARLAVTAASSFTVSVSPPTLSVVQGGSASYTITFTAVNGFTGAVTPAVSGLPTSATGQFASNSITPTAAGATTTLTIATTASGDGATPLATSTITVSGSSTGVTQSGTAQLTVQAPGSLVGTIQ